MPGSTTVDRSRYTFFLRRRTFAYAYGLSAGVFAFLPALALLCGLAGVIAYLACVIGVVLMGLLGWGAMIVGGLAVVVGIGMHKEKKPEGPGVAGVGVLVFVAGLALRYVFEGWYEPVWTSKEPAAKACFDAANSVIVDAFLAYDFYSWPWALAVAATAAAALTLLLLAALWLETALKYAVLRIGYLCPKCHQCLVPHFRCPKCANLLTDLRPSAYGVWHAACGGCGTRLPTTDLGGRLRLDKVCRNDACRTDLTDPALGAMSECRIAVVGAQSSGKTALMLSAVWQMEEDFAPARKLKMAFASAAEEQAYRQAVAQLRRGQVPPKTGTSAAPHAFNVSLKPAGGRGTLLYLYDTAGEDFEDGAASLSSHLFDKRLDGVLFVLDPFAEKGWVGRLTPSERGRTNPAAKEATEILGQLLPHWERCLHVPPSGRFPIPLAVVVTKVDAAGLGQELGGRDEVAGFRGSPEAAAARAEGGSARVRQFLDRAGMGNFVRVVEERFDEVTFFGATALGRQPDPRNSTAFRPRGVLGPLVWLCVRTHAITDAPGALRAARHLISFGRRCLRGAEGGAARAAAWALLLAAMAAVGAGALWVAVTAFASLLGAGSP